ncbi:bifunctional UDP-sugar hydrolase/5'-nucleotidase [Mesonia sp. K7]|uniref:bifunctional metallophosphatase/5'-nucleotidase n=1 Tax=Mesonia sp. K7 TaxID=2218606 RepID=UPI000DA7EAD6|nr:metallophosphatase [Mesonia sp. K7]PZD79572.1 bifunctional metallophosphatase/5'-nucleotidase [Mesonia sp. K7]
MKRKEFIQKSIGTGIFVGLSSYAFSSTIFTENTKHVTILHTNDVHSHIDPFPNDGGRNANKGGVSRRYSLIQQIRKENPNTLLLDAGDIFQGTPYFNFYGGELEFKLMSKLGYDAATIGNHDFDNGIDGLWAQMPNAQFKLLNANYDFSNTVLDGQIKPYEVFVKDDVRIGVFGLGIELEGLVNKKMYKETQYLDPVEIATDIVKKLKTEEKCDLVICLSHLGYQYEHDKIDDLKLAQQTQDIDLIIGGHTHTFLDEPTVVKNKINQDVLVNQVGWAGIYLGRIDFYLDKNTKTVKSASLGI